jgi:Spy/CpxP family protein refolding chaperone
VSVTKTTVVATLVLLLTFGAGFAAGMFTGHMTALRIFRPERLPQFATHAIVSQLDRKLDLSDAQRKKIEEIINRRHRAIHHIRGDVDPQIRAQLDKANQEITRVLTPEQRKKFEALKMRLGPYARRWRH